MPDLDPIYVAARRVLLDALEALALHQQAVIVVGAQAVYLRTGTAEIGIAPFTTDADLALDPAQLRDQPLLEAAMQSAHFQRDLQQPGVWLSTQTVNGADVSFPVDLIVPTGAIEGGGRRGARLGPHGNRAARKATGLEAALIDHTTLTVDSLEIGDERSFQVEVAGSAALLIAKAHKIHDRLETERADRSSDKDAADIYRLMQVNLPQEIAETFNRLLESPLARAVTETAIDQLTRLFGRPGSAGNQMAIRALQLAVPEAQLTALSTAFIAQMNTALQETVD